MDNHILRPIIENNVHIALAEDIGRGDLTAQLVPENQLATANIISRQSAIVCGIAWANQCFKILNTEMKVDWHVADGDSLSPNQVLCSISGNARSMLTAERCALNFLQVLSATATATHAYVSTISGSNARILDTRKTLPGLRVAQKYAVTVGGGMNQRLGLDDGILIKENHIAAAGSIEAVLKNARAIAGEITIQIEVETLSQLKSALDADAKLILLDNFSVAELAQAVKLNHGRAILEASGGIDLSNVREIALTGVDRISVGSLTKNISAIDLSMRFKPHGSNHAP